MSAAKKPAARFICDGKKFATMEEAAAHAGDINARTGAIVAIEPLRPRLTASELKYRVTQTRHDSHFFDRATLKFFGDTMRNFAVDEAAPVTLRDGSQCMAYRRRRIHAVKMGNRDCFYFCADTFKQLHGVAK